MSLNIQKAIYHPALPIRSCVGLLLLLYISGFLFSPALVRHTEHDHVVHEEDTCRKDPCHVSIYHNGSAGSCNHKFHFTNDEEKCPWCDVTLARHLATTDILIFSIDFISFSVEELNPTSLPLSISSSHSGRGPPAFRNI